MGKIKQTKIDKLVMQYSRAKTRSTHMRLHWAIAKEVQTTTGQSIGSSRKIATALAKGAKFAKHDARFDYRYVWEIRMHKDGEVRPIRISVVTDSSLTVGEQKKRLKGILKEQEDKKEYQGWKFTRIDAEQKHMFVRGKQFGKKEEKKYEKTKQSRSLRELRKRTVEQHAREIAGIDEEIEKEERVFT